jgi:O-antigen ligase
MGIHDRRAGRMHSLTRDPVALILALALIGLVPIALHGVGLPGHRVEWITAVVVALFFLLTVLRSPANGLVLLYLLPPLFNGEDSRPYFWLFELLVYSTLAAGFGRHLWRRRALVFPQLPFFLLFLLATLVSVPLSLKELWLQIQVSPWREVLEGIRRANLWEDLFYVRTVFNVASGIGLAVLVVNEPWSRPRLLRLAAAATLVYAAVAVIGLWCYRLPVAPGQTFLTLWLGGNMMGGFQGLGFNLGYFAQYALCYLPLVVLTLVDSPAVWPKVTAVFSLLVTVYMIPTTRQRAAYVLFLLELAALLAAGTIWWWRTRSGRRVALAVSAGAVFATLAGLLAFTALRPAAFRRVLELWQEGDLYRRIVLGVARRMVFDEPMLGVGSGRFAGEFSRYHADPAMQWGSLSAHNLYAQLLAEQGVIGLACFVALVTVVVVGAVRAIRQPTEERTVVFFLLASLGVWLVYGGIQYTFLIRSMQGYFWITAGLLVALAPSTSRARRWRPWSAVLAVVLALAVFRVHAVLRRPVPLDYEWGFHAGDAAPFNWTRGGAVLNLPAQGRVLILSFAFPIPHVTEHLQRVIVLVDGVEVRRFGFRSPTAWEVVEVPIVKPRGAPVLVQVRVSRSVVPATLGLSADTRRFGVLMKPPSWR